jgi:hypothetical protein
MRSIGIAALLALASCGGGDGEPAARDSLAESPPGTPVAGSPGGISFDPAALTRGTPVGTLVADMLVLSRAADSTWVGSARFRGELTLTGRAIPHFASDVHEVCFEADSAGAAVMPRWSGDTRRPWFCFSNQPDAQQSLAALHEERPATVVIDRFTINKSLSNQVNSARLVRVVKRGAPVPRAG